MNGEKYVPLGPEGQQLLLATWAKLVRMDGGKSVEQALAERAPAGYGLGGNAPFISDCNEATDCGWYAWGADCANAPFQYSVMQVLQQGPDYLVQEAFTPNATQFHARRTKNPNTTPNWTPWEWINPPMLTGVEYRTTERWNGRPVFAQRYNLGSPINGKVFTPSTPSGTIENIVRGAAFCSNAGRQAPYWGGIPGTFGPDSFFVDLTYLALTVRCGSAYQASWSVLVELRYVKVGDV